MYSDLSEKWKNQCEWIKKISQPIDLKSFGVDKLENNISKQFQVVQFMTQTQYHLEKLYTNPDHFCFNRNSNIMAYDRNRVLLNDGQNKESADHYINANYVQICDHKVIATQGPLHSTINSFWRMVDQQKVTTIFMLCQRVEKTKVKCDLYWPTDLQVPLDTGDYQIRLLKRQEDGKYIRHRRLQITNKTTKQKKEVSQYQFSGWPDGDKPLQAAEKSLIKLLKKFVQRLEKDEIVVVHCSAGVGRTGTFIAMGEIKMIIPKTEALSIFEIVRKLRQQRWAMVYTATQYQFLYQFTEKQSLKFFQPHKDEVKQCDSSDANDSNDDCEGDEMNVVKNV